MQTIYGDLVAEKGDPFRVRKHTPSGTSAKRERHRAARLTQQVWDAIEVEHIRDGSGKLVKVIATVGEMS